MRFIGVLNGDGGTFGTIDMGDFVTRATAIFAGHGHQLECRVVRGADLIGALERAAEDEEADVILAGGGDGTISAAAGIAFRSGKRLAVLPAGTMNFFAQTLRMPLDLEEALDAVAGGQFYEVDIASANGRPFLHEYSVGLHARLVRIREQMPYRGRLQKIWANLRAVSGVIHKPLEFQAEIRTARGLERRIAAGIMVSNNLLAEGHLPYADRVDGGVLGVYVAKPMTWGESLKLLVLVALGRWKDHPRVSQKEVSAVTISFPRLKKSARAVIDGELIPLASKVTLSIHPRALKVMAPAALAAVIGGQAESAAAATEPL